MGKYILGFFSAIEARTRKDPSQDEFFDIFERNYLDDLA
jgi:hypothetical protein